MPRRRGNKKQRNAAARVNAINQAGRGNNALSPQRTSDDTRKRAAGTNPSMEVSPSNRSANSLLSMASQIPLDIDDDAEQAQVGTPPCTIGGESVPLSPPCRTTNTFDNEPLGARQLFDDGGGTAGTMGTGGVTGTNAHMGDPVTTTGNETVKRKDNDASSTMEKDAEQGGTGTRRVHINTEHNKYQTLEEPSNMDMEHDSQGEWSNVDDDKEGETREGGEENNEEEEEGSLQGREDGGETSFYERCRKRYKKLKVKEITPLLQARKLSIKGGRAILLDRIVQARAGKLIKDWQERRGRSATTANSGSGDDDVTSNQPSHSAGDTPHVDLEDNSEEEDTNLGDKGGGIGNEARDNIGDGMDVDASNNDAGNAAYSVISKQHKNLTTKDIKSKLKDYGLPTSGLKAVILDRLVQHEVGIATDGSNHKSTRLPVRAAPPPARGGNAQSYAEAALQANPSKSKSSVPVPLSVATPATAQTSISSLNTSNRTPAASVSTLTTEFESLAQSHLSRGGLAINLLICTFQSPVGLSSPVRLTKGRPELQAHSTTHILD